MKIIFFSWKKPRTQSAANNCKQVKSKFLMQNKILPIHETTDSCIKNIIYLHIFGKTCYLTLDLCWVAIFIYSYKINVNRLIFLELKNCSN